MVGALSDAKTTQQNIYLLYVDFTSAFNTIGHDKLLCIMYDLGFPLEAVNKVRDLYQNATTRVRVDAGTTNVVKIERGTIQGDRLSPLLFLLFMEPLLRWLHTGGRGYEFGCLEKTAHKGMRLSSGAYADDLAALANTIANLRIQTRKIDLYAKWGGLKINNAKSGVTACLYRDVATGLVQHTHKGSAKSRLYRQLSTVQIDGQPIPILHPDEEAYTYLGVDITATLNWDIQAEKLIRETLCRTHKVLNSFATPVQRRRFIQANIQPYITYCFAIAQLTSKQLGKLDKILVTAYKRSCRLPISTPNAMVMLPECEMGMGLGSLRIEYVQIGTAALIKALNDRGPLGTVTRELLPVQQKMTGGLASGVIDAHAAHCNLARQAQLAKEAGITIQEPCAPTDLDEQSQQLTISREEGNTIQPDLCGIGRAIRDIGYDPRTLGVHEQIPMELLLPLMEIGIRDLTQITVGGRGKVMFNTTDLQNKYGRAVKKEQMCALNKISILLNEEMLQDTN